jgi:hypothetical protein
MIAAAGENRVALALGVAAIAYLIVVLVFPERF